MTSVSVGQDGGPHEQFETAGADRLRVLAAMEDEQDTTDVLLAALHHAAVEFGALGGMAHLDWTETVPSLRLVRSSGLPGSFTRPWRVISPTGSAAPARVYQDGGYLWLPQVAPPEYAFAHIPGVSRLTGVPEGTGIAAVALPGPGGPIGALSLLTSPSSAEPDGRQRAFLGDVARWAAGQLRTTPPDPDNVPTALLEPDPGRAQGAGTAPMGTWDWNVRTGDLAIDDMLLKEVGVAPENFDGRIETWASWVHPDDLPWLAHLAQQAFHSPDPVEFDLRLRRGDGGYGWVRNRRQMILGDDGEPSHVVGTVWDITRMHNATESVSRALRDMSDGFLFVDEQWRVAFANITAERLLGFPSDLVGSVLWDLASNLRVVEELRARCHQAVAEGRPNSFDAPCTVPGGGEWYNFRLIPVPDGGLALYTTDITDRRQREAARQSADARSALIGGLTRRLAEAVTVDDVVAAVADSVLPAFGATGLIVSALEGDRFRMVGCVGYPEAFRARVRELSIAPSPSLMQSLCSRTPRYQQTTEEYAFLHPELGELASLAGKQARVTLPLVASDRDIGMVVISFDEARRFDDDDRTLLTALSGLIAQGLDRAGLYDDATTRARSLQRALLPHGLPSLPAVTSAARYVPAGAATEVGGDWYDIIPLSADRVALVVGDVMSHGMPEAATMGRLRTAARTLSDLELPPDELLARLGDLVAEEGEDSFTTCLYGVYDPVAGLFSYASAGHPSPAVVLADGTVTFPTDVPDPPLGVAAPPFSTVERHLPRGSLLALYTDGLVESGERDIGDGMTTLAGILGPGRTEDLETLCDKVMDVLLPGGAPADDAALLLTRPRRLASEDVAVWRLPEDPIAAGLAREHVRRQLGAWHLEELGTTTELIASELVGNVIRHATGPIQLRLLHSRTLICEVSDSSLTTPHIRHPSLVDEGGRGLQLVAAVAQRWGTRPTATGKCIWTEQAIAGN
ncbi:SpoIIE family protein phosphatase [Streptomyces sulfonofaciens]|uniref:SpoIIE family protein phosphatase n=1 Tax=Streptomyces sulfonofaciens TaxID=68272 RepID=UPI00167BBA21|nr:SpoIIE family protein phosphatase [Streptomyces sulfonofaciens]